jgi:hypothetical protein
MSQPKPARLPKAVRDELEGSGVSWSLEKAKKHDKLVVGGRVVAVVSRGNHAGTNRREENLLATVRRVIRRHG